MPANQQMLIKLIQGLAKRDGLPVAHTPAPGLQVPEEGIPLWLANPRADKYSPRTIEQYKLVVKNCFLVDEGKGERGIITEPDHKKRD